MYLFVLRTSLLQNDTLETILVTKLLLERRVPAVQLLGAVLRQCLQRVLVDGASTCVLENKYKKSDAVNSVHEFK